MQNVPQEEKVLDTKTFLNQDDNKEKKGVTIQKGNQASKDEIISEKIQVHSDIHGKKNDNRKNKGKMKSTYTMQPTNDTKDTTYDKEKEKNTEGNKTMMARLGKKKKKNNKSRKLPKKRSIVKFKHILSQEVQRKRKKITTILSSHDEIKKQNTQVDKEESSSNSQHVRPQMQTNNNQKMASSSQSYEDEKNGNKGKQVENENGSNMSITNSWGQDSCESNRSEDIEYLEKNESEEAMKVKRRRKMTM